jgi:hypothetical protein
MRPTNRGQVEVQFNWIFILIVGAILLSFFVTIALRQKESSEQKISVSFFTNFERALGGIAASPGKQLLFEIPKMDLRYDCTAACDCAAYAGTRTKAQFLFPMNDKIIFSPNRLKGNNLLTWSKDWSFPFRVANFILMSSPEVKYLIEDTPQGKSLYNDLPPLAIEREGREERAFDKQLFDPKTPITSGISGNYKAKFIFTDTDPTNPAYIIPSTLQELPNSDVTAIKITTASAQQVQTITFYQKDKVGAGAQFRKTGQSYLFGDETLFAAVFAEDLNAYGCMMDRAFTSLNMVARIYEQKQLNYTAYFEGLKSLNDPTAGCLVHYDATAMSQFVQGSSTFDFKKENQDAAALLQQQRTIAAQNDNALKASCPQLY